MIVDDNGYTQEYVIMTLDGIRKYVDSDWPLVVKAQLLNGAITPDEAMGEVHMHGFMTNRERRTLREAVDALESRKCG